MEDSNEPGVDYEYVVEYTKTDELPKEAQIVVEAEDEESVRTLPGGVKSIDVEAEGVRFDMAHPEDWHFTWGTEPREITVNVTVEWRNRISTMYTFSIGYTPSF